ncbi:MAG: hypothetical protein DCF20_20640, partial [Pseudanabaena sp.]
NPKLVRRALPAEPILGFICRCYLIFIPNFKLQSFKIPKNLSAILLYQKVGCIARIAREIWK